MTIDQFFEALGEYRGQFAFQERMTIRTQVDFTIPEMQTTHRVRATDGRCPLEVMARRPRGGGLWACGCAFHLERGEEERIAKSADSRSGPYRARMLQVLGLEEGK